MAKTVNGRSYADMIRMIAKSIYDDADDIAGKTEGCTEIEISFDIETSTDKYADFPTYTVTRRHYPRKDLIEDFIRMRGASETEEERPVLSIDSDPVAYKEMLDAEIERAKTANHIPTQVTLSHDEALSLLGKCCATCKYGNDIENPVCDVCIHGDHVYEWQTKECWEDY